MQSHCAFRDDRVERTQLVLFFALLMAFVATLVLRAHMLGSSARPMSAATDSPHRPAAVTPVAFRAPRS